MTEQKYYYKSTTKKEFNCVKDDEKLIETLSDKGYTVYSVRQKTNQLIPYHATSNGRDGNSSHGKS